MTNKRHIVCFGEMLLRLSSAEDSLDLINSSEFAVHVAGAEANVAISIASLGQAALMATVLPDNALGDRAHDVLSNHKVGTSSIVRKPGRMGLFFLNSQVTGREGGLIYDRSHSAFALSAADEIDWNSILSTASWLHISGITAALGERPLEALYLACRVAKQKNVKVSFDCNYRPALWKGREQDAPDILAGLAAQADLLFAGPWDVSLITGFPLGEEIGSDSFEAAVDVVFDQFAELETLAATSRTIITTGHHMLGAHIGRKSGTVHVEPRTIKPIVDRIGSGDSFAAAVLYGLEQAWADSRIAQFALQACISKHGIHGDYSTLSAAQIDAAMPIG